MGEGERERERRPAERTERARSRGPCLGEVGVPDRTGECVRLEDEEPLRRGLGGTTTGTGTDLGEEDPLERGEEPNQSERRAGLTGIVMSEWITCVSGAAMGAGKVGGRAWNTRSKGGKILQDGQ